MTIRPLLVIPSALACLAPAFASEVCTFQGQEFTDAWPGELSNSSPFGRTSSGEVSGDGLPDALVLEGGHAVLLVDPDCAFAPVEVPFALNDACILAGHLNDGRGAIATVGTTGLNLCSYSSATGVITAHASGLSAWSGAKRVCSADLDASGKLDLVGVGSDARTILLAKATGNEFSVQALASFTAASDVLDVVPLQWIAGGAQEIALLTNTGLFVHGVNGALLASFPSVLSGGSIARITQQGKSTDRLTWITTYAPPAQQWLFTLSAQGVEGQIDLGGLDVVASSGADFDRDGDDDLLLSHRFSYELVYLDNQRAPTSPNGVSFSLTTGGSRIFPAGPPNTSAPENHASPALADFDSDGDIDVVFPCERNQEIRYLRGDWVDESTQRIAVSSASYDFTGNRLTLQLTAPATPPNATSMVVDAWYESNDGANVQHLGVDRVIQTWPTTWPAAITVDLPGSSSNPQAVYWIEVRAVHGQSSGAIDAAKPMLVAAFTRDAATAQILAAEPDTTGTMSAACSGGTGVGEVRMKSRLRRYGVNQPPANCQPN